MAISGFPLLTYNWNSSLLGQHAFNYSFATALLWRRHSRRWKTELSAKNPHYKRPWNRTTRTEGVYWYQQTSHSRGDRIFPSAGKSVHKECRYKYCNKKPNLTNVKMETSGPLEPLSTTSLWAPVNQFFTLLNIVYFAVSLYLFIWEQKKCRCFSSKNVLIFKQL